VPGQWLALAYLAGGDLLRWLPEVLGAACLEDLIKEASGRGGARLLFVPHLGGRILPAAPAARGAWVGLDLSQTRGDLARAVLESVAFEYAGFLDVARRLFPDVAPGDVRVIGGGGDDALWNEIKASVLHRPYVRLGRESFSCWGAALVAAAAAGAVDDLAALALSSTAEVDRALPDPDLEALYARRRRDYTATVNLLVPAPEGRPHQEVHV
jgi:xylulokinase